MQIFTSQPLSPAIFSKGSASDGGQASDKTPEASSPDKIAPPNARQQLTVSTRATDIPPPLTPNEAAQLRLLKSRDREVRAHEQAHANVGGPYAGPPNYQYTKGPDGRQYASSGHVNIDISKIAGDPEATLQKALQLKRAALAPAQPSQQDHRIAANAQQLATEARANLNALLLKAQNTSSIPASGMTIDTFV